MNIAFVPLRCGSQSIPFKNIKLFCNKPLIFWSLKALENAKGIDKIVVAIDCDEIKTVVESFLFSKVVVFDRNRINAGNTATTESVMLEYINQVPLVSKDLFVLVQATSPLIQSRDVDNALGQFDNKIYDSLLSCVRVKRFYWNDDGTPLNYNYFDRPTRQEFEGTFIENGAIYINSVGNIKRHKNRLGNKVQIYEMPEYTAIELDEYDDWSMAEKLMRTYQVDPKKSKPNIKLFLTDVDGTLTDAGMYYGENGEEFKKFNTHDGKGFELLRQAKIKTGFITSENTTIVKNRADKLKVDYLYQGVEHSEKLDVVMNICSKENITLDEVAYIGDDINCMEILTSVGLSACPSNAVLQVQELDRITVLSNSGGNGAVREFIDLILSY